MIRNIHKKYNVIQYNKTIYCIVPINNTVFKLLCLRYVQLDLLFFGKVCKRYF